MPVKELIDILSTEKPDAPVYTMVHDDNIALIVPDVKDEDNHRYLRYRLKIDIPKYFYYVSHAKALDMFRSTTDDESLIELISTIINNTESH